MKDYLSNLPKLATPAQRALANAGIKNLDELTKCTEAEIKELHGIGSNALAVLKAALKAKRLSFTKNMSL